MSLVLSLCLTFAGMVIGANLGSPRPTGFQLAWFLLGIGGGLWGIWRIFLEREEQDLFERIFSLGILFLNILFIVFIVFALLEYWIRIAWFNITGGSFIERPGNPLWAIPLSLAIFAGFLLLRKFFLKNR
ncbi:MAG: hypothetical protein WA705_27860 [Candidatus Ozemobacteraceae bacterium]